MAPLSLSLSRLRKPAGLRTDGYTRIVIGDVSIHFRRIDFLFNSLLSSNDCHFYPIAREQKDGSCAWSWTKTNFYQYRRWMIEDTINIYNIYILDEKDSWIVENFRTIITTRERERERTREDKNFQRMRCDTGWTGSDCGRRAQGRGETHGFLNIYPRITREFCINEPRRRDGRDSSAESRQKAEAAKRLLWIRMFWVPSISSRVFSRALSARRGIIFVWWKKREKRMGRRASTLSLLQTINLSVPSLSPPPFPSFFFRFFSFFFFFLPYVPLQFRDERGCNDHRRPVFGNEARWVDDVDLVCIQRWLEG